MNRRRMFPPLRSSLKSRRVWTTHHNSASDLLSWYFTNKFWFCFQATPSTISRATQSPDQKESTTFYRWETVWAATYSNWVHIPTVHCVFWPQPKHWARWCGPEFINHLLYLQSHIGKFTEMLLNIFYSLWYHQMWAVTCCWVTTLFFENRCSKTLTHSVHLWLNSDDLCFSSEMCEIDGNKLLRECVYDTPVFRRTTPPQGGLHIWFSFPGLPHSK